MGSAADTACAERNGCFQATLLNAKTATPPEGGVAVVTFALTAVRYQPCGAAGAGAGSATAGAAASASFLRSCSSMSLPYQRPSILTRSLSALSGVLNRL